MNAEYVRLKYLLQQRHWQTHRTFCSEFDKAARTLDSELVGTWPSRAQLHRWLSGELKGLPHPDACRVLEKMFPGWSAAQLFQPISAIEAKEILAGGTLSADEAVTTAATGPLEMEVFADLNEEDNRAIVQRIRAATEITFLAHTGYNAMVSQYQAATREAVARGCTLRVIVSDPEGPLMAQPELTVRLCPSIRQEGEIQDVLTTVARHRKHAVSHGHSAQNVEVRVYAGVPTMNVLLIDGWMRLIPYLPLVDASESPVFEHRFDPADPTAVIAKYLLSLDRLWANSRAVDIEVLPV